LRADRVGKMDEITFYYLLIDSHFRRNQETKSKFKTFYYLLIDSKKRIARELCEAYDFLLSLD